MSMGTLWLGDAAVAARVLMEVRKGRRRWVLERMLTECVFGALYRARLGRAHPRWGTGSLMAVALRRTPPAEPPLSDADFRRCLVLVLERLGRPEPRSAARTKK